VLPNGVSPNADYYGNSAQICTDCAQHAIESAKNSAIYAEENAKPAIESPVNSAIYADENAAPAVYAVGTAVYHDESMFFLLKDSNGNYLAQDRGSLSESNLDDLIERSFPTPYLEKVNGYHNQMATNTDKFNISLVYGNADVYRYKLDNGNWSEWKTLEDYNQTGYLTISEITDIGSHKIIVEIKNSTNDLTSRGYTNIFKL
jgi:hypothetical protein